jgi:hypothetical protein
MACSENVTPKSDQLSSNHLLSYMVDLPSKNGKMVTFHSFFHVYQAGYHHGPQENLLVDQVDPC